MDAIYSLIPGMIFLGLVMVAVLVWAIRKGQYEDFEGDGNRILMDDDDPRIPGQKPQQKKQQDQRNWPDADDDD